MKWRCVVSQNCRFNQFRQTPTLRQASTPSSILPPGKKLLSITSESLQTYQIDLSHRASASTCKSDIKAVMELEHRLRSQASQFIAKLAKEKMHLKGRLMLSKQQEEKRRQIQLEIQRYERTLREKKELMQKQGKYQLKALFFERRTQERQINKMRSRKHLSLIKSEQQGKTNTIEKSKKKVSLKQDRSQHIRLKNTVYLDEQQQKVQQTRKRLLQLQITIQKVEKIKQNC